MNGVSILRNYSVAGLLVAVFALAVFPLRAEEAVEREPRRLTLSEALQIADQHNPLLLEARERQNEQSGRRRTTHGSAKPDAEAFGSYLIEDDGRVNSFGTGNAPDDTQWIAGVRVRQPLYSGGRLAAAMEREDFRADALVEAESEIQMQVFTEVHRHYFDAVLARSRVEVQTESLRLLEQQLELARNRFDAGAAPRFDVMQAEVRVASANPPLIRARNEYRIALEDLRATLGLSGLGLAASDVELVDEPVEVPGLPVVADALDEAMRQRPDLLRLELERKAAEADFRVARRKRAPEIDFVANYTVENDRFSPDSSETFEGWLVGLEASLPVWEGGRLRGEAEQARSRVEQSRLREEQHRLSIEVQVRKALHRAEEAREILQVSELLIAQAEEAHRLAENRYRAGSLTQLDVLSAALDLTQARLEQVEATRDFRVEWVELQRAMGRLPGGE